MTEQLADTSSVYTFVFKTVKCFLIKVKVKVKQSLYSPGQALRVPGG